ncbi:hypothetical protein RFI_32645, partial [Reticulomyxa filosa]
SVGVLTESLSKNERLIEVHADLNSWLLSKRVQDIKIVVMSQQSNGAAHGGAGCQELTHESLQCQSKIDTITGRLQQLRKDILSSTTTTYQNACFLKNSSFSQPSQSLSSFSPLWEAKPLSAGSAFLPKMNALESPVKGADRTAKSVHLVNSDSEDEEMHAQFPIKPQSATTALNRHHNILQNKLGERHKLRSRLNKRIASLEGVACQNDVKKKIHPNNNDDRIGENDEEEGEEHDGLYAPFSRSGPDPFLPKPQPKRLSIDHYRDVLTRYNKNEDEIMDDALAETLRENSQQTNSEIIPPNQRSVPLSHGQEI